MINIKMQTSTPSVSKVSPKITVIGVGGAGGNAVNNMISSNLEGCEFIVCNTDAQALEHSLAQTRIQLGTHVTGGLGAGSKPEIGQAAAEESLEDVMQHLEGANMAFVTAGMGGGTGTGAAPVIAKACREMGILTVGVVTKPFHFEGAHRMRMAESGLEKMQEYVDTLIVIPNQNLFRVANEKTTFAEAFRMADSVLQSGVRGVTDLMVRPGLVNLDFADIRTAMMEMGKAMMGTGEAQGDKRAIQAAEAAINNPLLDDVSMKGAHGVIINVTGGYDMTLFEADEACNRVRDEVDPDANIIFGATFDESLEGKMRVSIVATGIQKEAMQKSKPQQGSGKIGRVSHVTPSAAKPEPQYQQSQNFSDTLKISAPPAPAYAVYSPPAQAQIRAPQNLSANAEVRTPQATAEQGQDIPEADLFDQARFTTNDDAADTGSAQNTALRGTRYKNAFIPPKPASIPASYHEGYNHSNTASTQQPQASALYTYPAQQQPMNAPLSAQTERAAPQPPLFQAQTLPQHVKSSGLVLNPPKMPTPPPAKPRTPSLLERISATVQQGVDSFTRGSVREENQGARHHQLAPSMMEEPNANAQNHAVSHATPSQPTLNIDSPSAAPSDPKNNLDIPAFLRRQAN